MDHQTRRFIYDHQRLIFVNDLDRNVFRRKDVCRRSDQLHFDLIVFAEFVGRFGWLAVYEDVFIFNQPLQTRAAPALELRSKIGVETNSSMSASIREGNPCPPKLIYHCDVRNLS